MLCTLDSLCKFSHQTLFLPRQINFTQGQSVSTLLSIVLHICKDEVLDFLDTALFRGFLFC